MTTRIISLLVLVVGCGDADVAADAGTSVDAAADRLDASTVDAPAVDAPLDAPPGDGLMPGDASPPDAAANPIFCTGDRTSGLFGSALVIHPLHDFIPLCNGQILAGDRVTNQIILMDLMDNARQLATYQLQSAPSKMGLDVAAGVLYVAMPPVTGFARVDLATGSTTTFPMSQSIITVAAGPSGKVFAAGASASLYVVDGSTGAVVQTITPPTNVTALDYDAADGQLIAGYPGGTLYRYVVSATGSLTFAESNANVGENCSELASSPIGGHLAYICGTGNPSGYNVLDYRPTSLAMTQGTWIVGPYPAGIAFSPSGDSAAISNSSDHVLTFSVASHAQLASYFTPATCSGTSQIELLRYSRGGRVLFAATACLTSSDMAGISWFVVP